MEGLRTDIAEFITRVLSAILGFFNGTDSEITEEQLAGINTFVDFIFGL